MLGETVEVAPGDVLVTRPPGPRPGLGWDELPGPTPAHLEEKPQLRQPLISGGRPFVVRTTLADCFAVLRTLYVLEGSVALRGFFVENEMVPRRTPTSREGAEEFGPEEFLPGDRRILYRLLDHARRRVEEIAAPAAAAVTPLAAEVAAQRLAAARTEIVDEVPRYLTGRGGLSLGSALDDRVSASLYRLDEHGPDVVRLRAEIRACRGLFDAAVVARTRWSTPWGKAAIDTQLRLFPLGLPEGDPSWYHRAIEEEVAREHPELAALAEQAAAARHEADAYLAAAAAEFPVLWRVGRTGDAENVARLGNQVLTALRTAYTANRAIAAEVARSPAVVWRYPAIVREALTRATVPEYSIAWRAAELELVSVAGPRLTAQLGLFSGLAVMGASAAAALVGASVLAPPIAVALLVVDVVINIIDAVQEYLDYRRQQAAAAAVLDPSRALVEPPSLLAAVLTIAFDLLAAVPGPLPGRVAVP